jgi:hypothetical protein
MLASSKVVISTIQRVHRALTGNDVADKDDPNPDDFVPYTRRGELHQGDPAEDVRSGHRG